MISTLRATMRGVARRIAADWPVVLAAFVTIFLSTMLLASAPIYADAVAASALGATIDGAPDSESNLVAETTMFASSHSTVDLIVRETVERAFGVTGADVLARVEAEAHGLSEQSSDDTTDLVSVQYLEGIEDSATIVTGAWPTTGATDLEVAVNKPAAEALGLDVGDRLDIANRRDDKATASLVVVGVFEPNDDTDPFWLDVPLTRTGLVDTASFRTHGPFVTTLDAIRSGLSGRLHSVWRVFPRYEDLRVGDVDDLRAGVAGLSSDLDRAVEAEGAVAEGVSSFTVTSDLTRLLAGVNHSLTVTRSSVTALMLQLAIMAGYALVLTAGLLTDARRSETALLRSRGMSPGQIGRLSLLEGLTLTLPCVVLAPLVTALLLRSLNVAGPLAVIGLDIDPHPTPASFLLAGLGALMAIAALAWPAWRAARRFGALAGRRQPRKSGTQRLGIDIALLALAALVIWQLSELGPEVAARVRGRFGVDPLLVVAPVLGLLAGAILALRVVPALARAAEALATGGRSTVAALASWQVARRPLRYARSSLLLIIAVGIGFFAASYSTTWTRSQREQAAHQVGADISVVPDRSSGSIPDIFLATSHESIDTVESSMPVWHSSGDIGERSLITRFVALDAAKALRIVGAESGLGSELTEGLEELVAGRPTVPTLALPGEPESISILITADDRPVEGQDITDPGFRNRVRLVLQDGDGLLHRLEVGSIETDGTPSQLSVPLSHTTANGATLIPRFPLSLVSVEIESLMPSDASRVIGLVVDGISVGTGSDETQVEAASNPELWESVVVPVGFVQTSPSITAPTDAGDGVGFTIETGTSGFQVASAHFNLRPGVAEVPETYPVMVSNGLVESGTFRVGETAGLPPLRVFQSTGLVVGALDRFPTIDPSAEETVLVDLPTIQMMSYEPGLWRDLVDEYWLATAGGHDDQVVNALTASPFASFSVASRQTVENSLVFDPIALGAIGALTIGFVAAALFAAVGFAVSAVVSARERLVEFSLLRALGLSPTHLGKWLLAEQGVLVLVSLVLGTALGIVLTAVLLPLITLTQDGQRPVPEVTVEFPWSTVAILELGLLVFLLTMVAVLSLVLGRAGLGRLIRLGEDR